METSQEAQNRFDRRNAEFTRNRIKNLTKLAQKYEWARITLMGMGIDCDYIPGFDDGEPPAKYN